MKKFFLMFALAGCAHTPVSLNTACTVARRVREGAEAVERYTCNLSEE